jgi:hypothetical protein
MLVILKRTIVHWNECLFISQRKTRLSMPPMIGGKGGRPFRIAGSLMSKDIGKKGNSASEVLEVVLRPKS